MVSIIHYLSGLAEIKAGIETFITNLYDHIDRDKFRFSILTRNAQNGSELYRLLTEKGIQVYDLNVHNLGISTIRTYVAGLDSFFQTHNGEFDFLHMHGYDDPLVVKTAKRWGVKQAALHVHQVTRENDNGAANLIKRFSSQDNMRRSDYLFACSNKAGKAMYGDRDFTVIRNCIDTESFRFDAAKRSAQRTELGLTDTDVALIYTGRLVPVKNLSFLLDVFGCLLKLNEHVKLYIVGEGEEGPELVKRAGELGIKDSVRFLGERNDIPLLLQGMDLYLQTSLHEGFPFSVLEAQCCGLPAVISDGFSPGIEVTDLTHRIPLSRSKEQWAEEILRIMQDHAVRGTNREKYADVVKRQGYDSYALSAEIEKIYSGSLTR